VGTGKKRAKWDKRTHFCLIASGNVEKGRAWSSCEEKKSRKGGCGVGDLQNPKNVVGKERGMKVTTLGALVKETYESGRKSSGGEPNQLDKKRAGTTVITPQPLVLKKERCPIDGISWQEIVAAPSKISYDGMY